jgi:hypothetical protein
MIASFAAPNRNSSRGPSQRPLKTCWKIDIGVRIEPEFTQGGDNMPRRFILDAKAVLRYGADTQPNEFGCAPAEGELTAPFAHLS